MMTSLLYDFTIVSRSRNSDQSDSSNLTFKNFPGGACPRTPLGGCASGARVRIRPSFRNSFDKGPMQHSDPGPKNSFRGPARVAPIFKGGKPDDRSDYRPISVLPVVSRLFEKLIYDQLYQYLLDKHKYLVSHQSGFRSLHSVVTCLLKGTSDWYIDLDNGRYTAMIFIDL